MSVDKMKLMVSSLHEQEEDHKASGGVSAAVFDKSSKISFPIPGTLKGHSAAKPVMELKSGA